MATVILRDVPDELFDRLKQRADRHGRSVDREALACLERGLEGEPAATAALLSQVREVRAGLPGLHVTDADLRAARDEGRP